MKKPLLFSALTIVFFTVFQPISSFSQVVAGRMNEVFLKTDLVTSAQNLQDPWEITYGPDDSLWITEAKGFRVRKISPVNGGMRTILDLTTFSDPASTPTTKWRKSYTVGATVNGSTTPDPQGGLMGLAIAPDYMTATKKYVYLAYVHHYLGANQTGTPATEPAPHNGEVVNGELFITWLTRWEYKNGTLQNPVALCDTIRGSSDHNSGRLIIVPVGGVNYLFEAVGDMGAGQFANQGRVNKAQWTNSYEGKIHRYLLDSAGVGTWIPASNPYPNSSVYCIGIRNNQGFAYDPETDNLYGSSHGPFSDDEVNIIQLGKNYGQPLVIGYRADNNYNNAKAGYPPSILPLIPNEDSIAGTLPNYQDPIYSAYPSTNHIIDSIYSNSVTANAPWPSEGWSGLGIYTDSKIPGWKKSLLLAGMKWGRIIKLRLNTAGTAVIPTGATDTVSYFGSQNRFRDMAFDPDGRTMYVTMDRSTTSSGPSAANPIVPTCAGCIHKYVFLGYKNVAGTSAIPAAIDIARGVPNTCTPANDIIINANNNNLWVPITDDSSNVIGEIKANGNNLGTVTTSFFYKNSGAVREDGAKRLYMDRNIAIHVQTLPASAINVRLYITSKELTRMISATNSLGAGSGVSGIGNIAIFSTTGTCGSLSGSATKYTTTNLTQAGTSSGGFVLLASIPVAAFSASTHNASFFFANNALTTLPTTLISFTGVLNANKTVGLNWKTGEELNLSSYVIERSADGRTFETIGAVTPDGSGNYDFTDIDAYSQPSLLIYYRLKMADNDQSYKYSNVITISLTDLVGVVVATPNPTAGIAKVTMTAAMSGRANWNIVDNTGRVMLQNSIQLNSGINSAQIDLSKLAAGIYYLNVSGAGINTKVKLQKL